jgi:hypothetical protein
MAATISDLGRSTGRRPGPTEETMRMPGMRFGPRHRRATGLFVAALVAIGAAPARPAAGQSAGVRLPPGFDEALRPEYVRRDLQFMTDALELDDAQQAIVLQLFLDYEMAVGAGNEALQEEVRERSQEILNEQMTNQRAQQEQYRTAMRQLVQEVRERQQRNKDPRKAQALRDEFRRRAEELRTQLQNPAGRTSIRVAQEFFETIEQWRRDKAAMGDAMMEGVQAILTVEQTERWPTFERQLTRQKLLGRGKLSGESLDLIGLCSETGIDRTAIRPLLWEYENAMHAALLAREQRLLELRRELMDAAASENEGRLARGIDQQIEVHLAVRAVNDRYLELLTEALGPQDGARLLDAARRRAYPRLFTPTLADRALARARELPDLGPDQLRAVDQLAQAYRTERSGLDLELIRRQRSHEPAELRRGELKQWGPPAIGAKPTGPPVQAIVDQRRELDQATTAALRQQLSEAQAEQVFGG